MAASVNRPASGFARHLGAYLAHIVEESGGDPSGRWLAARTSRGKGYVASLMTGEVAMNTNDIALFAAVFGVSPYQFVRDARDWNGGDSAETSLVTPPTPPTDLTARRAAKSQPTRRETSKPPLKRVAKKRSKDRGGDDGQG